MLYLITNRHLVPSNRTLIQVIKKSVRAGVQAIILREKDLSTQELLPIALEIKKICDEQPLDKRPKLIINSNQEVAQAVNADGLHVSFNFFTNSVVRYEGTIGVSIHSIEEAVIAEQKGANYLLAGHIFATDCKKGLAPRGLTFIKSLKRHVKIPVIALGGIVPENYKSVLETGADGIAVMSTIMKADDIYKTTKSYS